MSPETGGVRPPLTAPVPRDLAYLPRDLACPLLKEVTLGKSRCPTLARPLRSHAPQRCEDVPPHLLFMSGPPMAADPAPRCGIWASDIHTSTPRNGRQGLTWGQLILCGYYWSNRMHEMKTTSTGGIACLLGSDGMQVKRY